MPTTQSTPSNLRVENNVLESQLCRRPTRTSAPLLQRSRKCRPRRYALGKIGAKRDSVGSSSLLFALGYWTQPKFVILLCLLDQRRMLHQPQQQMLRPPRTPLMTAPARTNRSPQQGTQRSPQQPLPPPAQPRPPLPQKGQSPPPGKVTLTLKMLLMSSSHPFSTLMAM